jgi:hypothetical protein
MLEMTQMEKVFAEHFLPKGRSIYIGQLSEVTVGEVRHALEGVTDRLVLSSTRSNMLVFDLELAFDLEILERNKNAGQPIVLEIDRETLYHLANNTARRSVECQNNTMAERVMRAAERIVAATAAQKPGGPPVRLTIPS